MPVLHHSGALLLRCIAGLLFAPALCSAYGGNDGYNPPPPICPKFKCEGGMKPAGNKDHKLWSYGCKDSGINFMNMASLDPNNPLGGMQQGKNVDKCCVERDICVQTCGTTAKQCHDDYWACSKKICKNDRNCEMSAMMGSIQAEAEEDREDTPKDIPKEYNYEKERNRKDCRAFNRTQSSACKCVPEEKWQEETELNLKTFYKAHNPEKLDGNGQIKDIADVWKKWKGKEPQMFQALATKYKKKAVMIKPKPKPPPYKPPPPLSKEEQEKEDKRMEENRKKWEKEDKQRETDRVERERKKAEEKAEEERRRAEEEDGETVEL